MSDFNLVLAERSGLGRVHLCGCNSVHLKIGPVSISLSPEAFAQASMMMRQAAEQLARLEMTRALDEETPAEIHANHQLIH
jgi:hypothetical protein